MARTSLTGRKGFDWRGMFRSGGSSAGRAAGARRRGGAPAGVEPLEGRQLLSVALVSATAAGQGAGAVEDNQQFAISDNGLFVAFTSNTSAADFGTGAADGGDTDVFLRNLASGAVTLISGSAGVARGGVNPSLSADGRYVAFSSDFGGFAAGSGITDGNGSNDVYVFDTQAGTYTPVSVNAAGTGMAGNAIQPSISNNGRVVAYVSTSDAGTIVSGVTDANGTARDVFVRNLDTNATTLVSASTAGATTTGNARSEEPAISGDGNFVAFMSQATDLTAIPDTAATNDVFRRAVVGTTTDLVSVGSSGGSPASAGGTTPSINGDGNLVAFASTSADIVPGHTGSTIDVFVRNHSQGTTQVASTTQAGALGEGNSSNPSISDNGNFVAFQTAGANLFAPGQNAAGQDIVVKNLTDGSVRRVSETDAGEPASAGGSGVGSSFPEVNADGTAVAFFSNATNFAPGTEDPAIADIDLFAWRSANVVPGDTTPPAAVITAPNVTAAGGATHQVTVVYSDAVNVDVTTVGVDDITVTGPGGATTPLTVSSFAANPTANSTVVTVVYTVAAPGGTWDAADDGTYTVTLPANAVRDTSANGVAAGSATFTVNAVPGGPVGPGPDLVAAVGPKPVIPPAVIGGSRGRMRLVVTNQGDQPLAPTQVSILLRAVPTGATTGSPVDITTVTRRLRLNPGRSRPVPITFLYPTVPDGTYNLVATVDSAGAVAEGDESNNTATTAAPVTIAAPFVDLTAEVGAPSRGSLSIGRRSVVPVILTNSGNVAARGPITIQLFASGDSALGGDLPLATVTRRINIPAGRSKPVRLSFLVDAGLPAGSYFIAAAVDTTNAIGEKLEDNNTAISGTAFQAV